MVKEIINWCNSNNGFATILLSALTLLVSIIAIIVSIHAARLPYKKKLIVSGGSFVSVGGIGLHITATNVGNRQIKISNIGFRIKKHVYINPQVNIMTLMILKKQYMICNLTVQQKFMHM